MRVLMGVLVALLGAFAGAALSIGLTAALLTSAGENDALIWAATIFVFCLFGIPTGAVLAVLLWRHRWPKPPNPASPVS